MQRKRSKWQIINNNQQIIKDKEEITTA